MVYPRSRRSPLTSGARHGDIRSHPASARSTAWAQLGHALLEFAERHGVARSAVLTAGHLDEHALDDRNGRIPLRSYLDMIERVAQSAGEHLGLRLVMEQPHGIEPLGFRMTTSDTLGDALSALVRFQRVLYDHQPYGFSRHEGCVAVSIDSCGWTHPAERHLVELVGYVLTAGSRALFGCPIDGAVLELRPPRRAFGRVFLEALGDRTRFEATSDRVLVPESELSKVLPGSSPPMRAYFERQLEAIVTGLPPPLLTEQARSLIEHRLERSPGLHDVAAALGLSSRTLQRRLRDEGTSVRALVDDARRSHAREILLRTGSVATTAQRLGYSEPSAFHRAFKRWTGYSPGEVLSS